MSTEIANLPPAAAPSAPAPTSPPAAGAAAAPAAPSAPVAPKLETLADYDRYATQALLAPAEPPPTAPPPAPAPPAVPSPEPPAPSAPAAGTESPPVAPPPPAASGQPDDDPEPSAEVLASLSDAGKRALQAERDKRKAAREELKTLRAELEALKAAQTVPPPPAPAAPSAPAAPPATPAAPAAPAPAVPENLAACRTFDQVDAAVIQATEAQATANELIMAMGTGDRESVIARLKAEKVESIGDTPIDSASDAQLRQVIVRAHTGAQLTITQANARKDTLRREAISFTEAQKILPGLGQATHADHVAFAKFVQENPTVRHLGPNWPQMVAEGVAHRLGRTKVSATPPPPAVPPPTPPPAPRAAPSAPSTSSAALPARKEIDEVRERLNSGKGTKADMDRYAVLAVRGG